MLKIIVAAVVAVSFVGLDAADAASKRKKQKVQRAPVATIQPKPPAHTRGPPWAVPGECFTDEGYGRYLPCGAGMDM
jgi:hypothetical protein